MRIVWAYAGVLAILLRCFCSGIRRSNNSPASRLLPTGDYFEDIEVLYHLDDVFRGIKDLKVRNSLARALLLIVPLEMGEMQVLNLREYVLGNDDMATLQKVLGVSIERAPDSNSGGTSNDEEKSNRWTFKRTSEIGSKSIELLLQDIVIGGLESGGQPSAKDEYVQGTLGFSVTTKDAEGFEEKMLVKQAYEDINSGKKSRSIMTRAQRIWELYQQDYQPFPKIKVRFFDAYRTGRRVGDECEVGLVSSIREALDLVGEAKACVCEGRRVFCLRHGASLVPLDLSTTFLRSELRPPGVNLYLMD